MRNKNSIRLVFGVLFAIHLIIVSVIFAQDPPSVGFTVDTTPVLPVHETHPGLYFNEEKITILMARRTDPEYAGYWYDISQRANEYRYTDPAFQNESARPRMAKTLAFWWLMEQDTTARDKAIDALMKAYDGVPQTGEKPYDEIYRATWLQNYCAAYDWVFDQLSAEEDSVIRARIADETQFLRDNLTSGIRMAPRPHNHRSKPAWAICTAALTLSDHPNAEDWLEYGLTQANTVTEYQFTEDGIYREGGHYWVYSAVNFIPFLWHYWNVSGVDLFQDYKPAFTWPVAARTGQGWIPNFEDSNIKPAPTHLVASAYLNASTEFHSDSSLGNVLQWNFLSANVFTPSYTGATRDVAWEVDNFILYDAAIDSVAPNCHPTIKLAGGQVIFRNRWQGGEGHRYLAFHGPSPGDNHNHPDQLSFVVEADRGFVMPDAGYGPDGFSDDRRNTWYTTAKAHNIITADYYTPTFIPAEVTPPTPYFLTSEGFSFAEKQMSFAIFPGLTQRRGIAFIGKEYWVVTDILSGGTGSHLYRSYLHGRGTFTRDGNHASWTSPQGIYGTPVRMDVFLLPSDMDIQEETGYISLFWDEGSYQYIMMDQQAVDALFMEILIPGAPGSPVSLVSDHSSEDYVAAEIVENNTSDFVFLQTVSDEVSVNGLSTDGTFGWRRIIQETCTGLAFREAQHFLIENRISINNNLPATMSADLSNSQVLALTVDLPDDTLTLEMSWLGGQILPSQVLVNGLDLPFDVTGENTYLIRIAPDGSSSVYLTDKYQPGQFLFTDNYPNPFNGQTCIRIESSYTGLFSLKIYNVRGQSLWETELSLQAWTPKQIIWHGQDDRGIPLPSGVYFGIVQDLKKQQAKRFKLLLVR